jgi:hypothetical protein
MKRRCLLAAALASGCLVTGCAHDKCGKIGTGWRFEVIRPPTVEMSQPLLIQQGPGMLQAAPLGAVAGPVLGGGWEHAPGVQMVPQGYAPPLPPLRAAPVCSSSAGDPYGATMPRAGETRAAAQPQRYTCEEWCELLREAQRRGVLPPVSAPRRMPPAEKE